LLEKISRQNRETVNIEKVAMEIAQYITVDPAIHHGIPVITGTRVPISIIIGSLAGGMSKEEVMQEYELSKTQVEAALSYATDLIKQTTVTALGA
jgi:uncharacterized protein (DUF433 family)